MPHVPQSKKKKICSQCCRSHTCQVVEAGAVHAGCTLAEHVWGQHGACPTEVLEAAAAGRSKPLRFCRPQALIKEEVHQGSSSTQVWAIDITLIAIVGNVAAAAP
jgi:hypothetical protein